MSLRHIAVALTITLASFLPSHVPAFASMADGNPVGNFEQVQRNGSGLHLIGWTLDPNVQRAIYVHAYVNGLYGAGGTFVTQALANEWRADVANAYPAYGTWHGFDIVVPDLPGPHSFCVYAINVGPGTASHSAISTTLCAPPTARMFRGGQSIQTRCHRLLSTSIAMPNTARVGPL